MSDTRPFSFLYPKQESSWKEIFIWREQMYVIVSVRANEKERGRKKALRAWDSVSQGRPCVMWWHCLPMEQIKKDFGIPEREGGLLLRTSPALTIPSDLPINILYLFHSFYFLSFQGTQLFSSFLAWHQELCINTSLQPVVMGLIWTKSQIPTFKLAKERTWGHRFIVT